MAARVQSLDAGCSGLRADRRLGPEGLDHGLVDELTESETFGSIVATLRRAEAAGHRPERLIDRALKAGPLTDADDPASLLRHRVQQLATRTSPGRGRGTRRRFIAGFIPEASGSMPEDMTRALTELRSLIEQRAQALADDALTEKPPWLKALGPCARLHAHPSSSSQPAPGW